MPFNIGQLVGTVAVEHSGVRRGMEAARRETAAGMRKIGDEADRGGKAAGERFSNAIGGRVKGAASELGKSWKSFGTGILAGLAVDRVVGFFSSATDAASDLQQTAMKSKVIFGDQAKSIDDWAKGSADAFGLSKAKALDAAAGFGDMLQQLGDTGEQAAATSQKVVQFAADLGSFNNVQTGDVLDRISASLRGEYDSLQALIPNINAARVEQEAMAATGKKNAAELTAQEKAHATLAIIQKDGARAQGDFARSAGSYAIEQQKAAARSEELSAQIGEKLLPMMTALQEITANQVLPAVSSVVGVVTDFAHTVDAVPGPVKAAVVALVAFHLLKAPLSSMLDTVRLKAMYAGDAIKGMGEAGASGAARKGLSGMMGLLGGPWGVAITGATALVGAWAKAQADAKADADDLTSSIDKQTGQFTQSSREIVANKIKFDVNPDDLELLKQAGVDLGKLSDEVLNGGPAFDARIAQLKDMAGRSGETGEAARGLYLTLLRERDAAIEAHKGHKATNDLMPDLAKNTGNVADKTQSAANAAGDAAPKTKTYADRVDDLKRASSEAATKTKELADAMLDVVEASSSSDSAAIDYNDTLDEAQGRIAKRIELEQALSKATKPEDRKRIRDELAEYTKGLDINTEAGRNNKEALIRLAADAREAAKASLENNESTKTVADTMAARRKDFLDVAKALGVGKEEAKKMADQYGLTKPYVDNLAGALGAVPEDVVSTLTVESAAANAAVAEAKENLEGYWEVVDGVPTFKPTTVSTPGLDATKGKVEGYWSVINGIPTFKQTSVSATVTGLEALREADRLLRSLPSFRAAVDVRAAARRAELYRSGGGPIPGYAGGTLIGPGTGTSDSIAAVVRETGRALNVSAGEFLSTDSSRRRNLAALEAGNHGAQLGVVSPYGDGGGWDTDSIDMLARALGREIRALPRPVTAVRDIQAAAMER